jgi:RNA polymerase sigma-70 factor, ECF subfamily
VFKGLASFDPKIAPFNRWLLQITANVFSNYIRSSRAAKRQAREESLDQRFSDEERQFEVPSQDPSPLEELVVEETTRRLREALKALPPQMRSCCELRYIHGLKYHEIASRQRISIETVKAHLHEARKRLLAKLRQGH